ncbi:hypothetical protein ABHF54_04205 [Nitrosomonas europaea]|nr:MULTISPECIES: hypothetical protein [Nitrosomonas]HNS58062.1 hypothetical protein [Nitrosomonas europaea]HRQ07981.1 hypothetical protein [Nitrosomonas europaea]
MLHSVPVGTESLMDDELKSLEDKIGLLIRLYQETREENAKLYRLLENAEAVNRQLAERMQTAAERLKVLLNNLPEG